MIPFEDWTLHGVWGSPPRFRGPAQAVVVHHSVTRLTGDAIADARTVENVIYKRGGFSMIAYSYLSHPDGTILEGRSADYRNGANRNDKGGPYANSNTVSVCCIGDYRTDKITQPQQQAFARLMSDLRRDGIITVDAELLAHRDLAYTQCPAGAYEQLLTAIPPAYDDDHDDEDNDMLTLIDTTTNEGWVVAGNVARKLYDPADWLAGWEGPVRKHVGMRYVIADLYQVTD